MSRRRKCAVVITTFNHAHFLANAVDSVLGQSLAAAEIIVVDDGSEDDPSRVLRDYPAVRLVRQANRGLAAARNAGWRASSSPFVAFLDADDWLRPNCLEIGSRQLEDCPDAAFTYGAYANHYWPSGRIVPAPFRPVPTDAFEAMLWGNPIGMHATVLYRRSALETAGGFEERLRACEDYDLYLRIAANAAVACCPQLLAEYRQHDSNMSRNNAFMLRSVLLVMDRIATEAMMRGMTAQWRAGVAEWKRWYVDNWAREARDAGPSLDALRQAPHMFALAPVEVIGKLLDVARWRLKRR